MESIIHDGRWLWPRHRNRITRQIIEATPPDFLPSPQVEDEVLWTPTTGSYTTKSAWDAIRPIGQKKPWCSIVWFDRNVPKWAFIVWLACLKRLATKDRLRDWGMTVPISCVLCNQRDESHAHLFFSCSFSSVVWSDVLKRNQIQRCPGDWDFEIGWASLHWQGTGFSSTICKLALAATLYHLWRERNSRIFTQKLCSTADVTSAIIADVRGRVCSWGKVPYTRANAAICHNWNMSSSFLCRSRS